MMTLHFYLRFSSSPGQQFFIIGNHPALGNDVPAQALQLYYLNQEFWHITIDVPKETPSITYKYILRNDDGSETSEWLADRTIYPARYATEELQMADVWNYPGEFDNSFFTQPFLDTLLKPKAIAYKKRDDNQFTHVFKIKAPLVQPNEVVCLMGNRPELGDWDDLNPLLMSRDGNWFRLALNLSNAQFPLEYKYGIYNLEEKRFIRYENGDNRKLYGVGKRLVTILHDGFIQLPNNTFKGAGIAIPVFSLRTAKSFGVGEFTDIKPLADWCTTVGMKVIQLLPVNDTTATNTWSDSYPYAPISVFALHPLYINLDKVAGKTHSALLKTVKKNQKALNELPEIDYETVMTTKWLGIKTLYPAMKEEWLQDKAYLAYYEANKHWLVPYAAFCHFRNLNQTADFTQWKNHASYDALKVEKLADPKGKNFDDLGIHLFVQYHLHLQLKEAVDYAHKQGIILKGDLPIGIYRNSADAWVAPDLYNMDYQAGAPPDDFAVKGQNWGFPTYNWQKMQEDGFAWWKQRFAQMSLYFDAFRIDHILGFFRIWSIPMDAVEGILGHFVPCIPVYQQEFAERGIWFDYDRYCQPFINDSVLYELLGEKTDWVKETFLQANGFGTYTLKEAYNTQRKIEKWFAETADTVPGIKEKLFDLLSNVILLPDTDTAGQRVFHFRIAMDSTSSFRYLDEYTRQQLKDLYVDYFFRRQDDFWRKQGMQKLPALKSATQMLVCGEDLGMVPECVPGVMRETGLLSLEIQRMPKDPARQFFHPADGPYMSVVTPSTHDMSTIRGWWEENAALSRAFYNQELGQPGEPPFYCEPWICKAILTQHLYSPAMWSIFQLQDLLSMSAELRRENPQEERINIPANPKHYWRYRMHLGLEDLQKADRFNGELRELMVNARRI